MNGEDPIMLRMLPEHGTTRLFRPIARIRSARPFKVHPKTPPRMFCLNPLMGPLWAFPSSTIPGVDSDMASTISSTAREQQCFQQRTFSPWSRRFCCARSSYKASQDAVSLDQNSRLLCYQGTEKSPSLRISQICVCLYDLEVESEADFSSMPFFPMCFFLMNPSNDIKEGSHARACGKRFEHIHPYTLSDSRLF